MVTSKYAVIQYKAVGCNNGMILHAYDHVCVMYICGVLHACVGYIILTYVPSYMHMCIHKLMGTTYVCVGYAILTYLPTCTCVDINMNNIHAIMMYNVSILY